MDIRERRSAERTGIELPIEIEVIGQPLGLDEDASGDPIERAAFPGEMRGQRLKGSIRDISINGARVASDKFPPILSRVAVRFAVPHYGPVEGVALVMWRRLVPHEMTVDGKKVTRDAGFGLVFESLSLDARMAIARLVPGGR